MAKPEMTMAIGLESGGQARPLRTDADGRLEVVNYRTVHAARVYHNAAQSISNSTWTALAFNSEICDTDGFHDMVTNNSRLTVIQAGTYFIGGSIGFAVHGTGTRGALLRLNGTTYLSVVNVPTIATYNPAVNVTAMRVLSAGDYVELMAWQSSGGGLEVNYTAEYSPYFWIGRL